MAKHTERSPKEEINAVGEVREVALKAGGGRLVQAAAGEWRYADCCLHGERGNDSHQCPAPA